MMSPPAGQLPDTSGEAVPNLKGRELILSAALGIVTGDRADAYGEPENNFEAISHMWSVYLGWDVSAFDVAAMMILLKVSRLRTSPENEDHWVDIAGYAACGGEVVMPKA